MVSVYTDTYANSYCLPDGHLYFPSDLLAVHAHSYPNSLCLTDGHADRDADIHSNGDSYGHFTSYTDGDANIHSNCDGYILANTHVYADGTTCDES